MLIKINLIKKIKVIQFNCQHSQNYTNRTRLIHILSDVKYIK